MTEDRVNIKITDSLRRELGDDSTYVDQHLADFLAWMRTRGRNPARRKPLSVSQSKNYHSRIDQLYRLVIDLIGPDDPRELTHEQADQLITWIDRDEITTQTGDPYSETSKRKFADALGKYFQWQVDRGAHEERWRSRIKFTDGEHESADKLNFKERWEVRQEALKYGSLPAYYECDSAEREKINGLVSQQLGKPKSEVTSTDWNRADDSTKVGSLVAVALETGIIPLEVSRARLDWYDQQRQLLKIPAEDSAKDRPSEELPLTDDTAEVLAKWIQERRHYPEYDETSLLWLNNRGNPYNSKNLCYLIRRLCEKAGIEHENRKIVWYSLRHNLGQSIEETTDISQARDQLRHKSLETTKQTYGKSTIESRRHTLEQINETAQRSVEDEEFNPYAQDATQTPARYPDQTPTPPTDTGTAHIDAMIADTAAARSELARKLLNGDE